MAKNVYQHFGIGDVSLSNERNIVTFLDHTSRMPNLLTRAVSSTFYGGALQPIREAGQFDGLFGIKGEHQVGYCNGQPAPWSNLIEFNPTLPNPPRFSKNTSMDEAYEVTKLAWLCQSKGRKCLILTPYVSQVNLINDWLQLNTITNVEATTIHKAQGQEADIVIWSVVANGEKGVTWFNKHSTLTSRPIANVALSRAKHQVFIIGAFPGQQTVAGEFLANWEKAGQSVPSAPQLQPQDPQPQQVVQAEPQQVQPQVQEPKLSPDEEYRRELTANAAEEFFAQGNSTSFEFVEQVEEQPISTSINRCHYFGDWFDWNGLDDYIWSELRKNGVCTQKRNSRWTEPRLTAWFSKDNVVYEYSGIRHESQGWPDWVEHLAQGIKGQYGDRYHKPNSVLVNVYRNGGDYVSMHKDDEPLFDNNQPIASVSLGATRAFAIGTSREYVDHTIDLEDKSLLLMLPGFQDKYWHGVPRQPDVQHARVNLTFRYVKPQEKLEYNGPTTPVSPQYIGAYAGIGARQTPQDILRYMSDQARILEGKGLILRTGDANGADKAFRDAAKHKLVYTPNQPIEQWARDEVSVLCDTEYNQMNEHTRNLLARNMYQLFGSGASKSTKQPSKFVLYWSLPSPQWDTGVHTNNYYNCSGGTRYAVRAACNAGIPTFNLYNQMKHWEAYRDNDFDPFTALSVVDERSSSGPPEREVSIEPASTENTPEVISQSEVPAPTDTSGELDPKFKEWLESTGRIDKYLDGPGYRKDHMKRVYKLTLEKTNK